MAQICNKNNQTTVNAFNSHKMFVNGIEVCRSKESIYYNVLDVFKKVFKNIKNDDFLV